MNKEITKEVTKEITKEITKEDIIKVMKSQIYALIVLLIIMSGGFIYMFNQIFELKYDVQTMMHELDYTYKKIAELEKEK